MVASDLSWRTVDMVQGYTLRWLVEVFFADWKVHEGWGQLTKQPDEDGSSRSLILSLLLDHCLLLHPHQLARLEQQTTRVHRGKPTTTHPRGRPAGLYPGTDLGRQPGRAVQPPESSCGRGVSTGPFENTPAQQRSWEARANTHLEISGGDGLGQCLKDRTMPCSLRRLP